MHVTIALEGPEMVPELGPGALEDLEMLPRPVRSYLSREIVDHSIAIEETLDESR